MGRAARSRRRAHASRRSRPHLCRLWHHARRVNMSAPKSMTERLLYRFSSPDRGRLAGAVRAAWTDFDTVVHRSGHATLTDPWARSAFRFLLQADSYLADGDLQQGWIALLSAQRAMLGGSQDPEKILRAAVGLRREMVKITGWRAKAI